MAAMYRSSPRLLKLCRQSCHVGHSYLEVSKCKLNNLQLAVGRCLSDSVKSSINFDFNSLEENDNVKEIQDKKSVSIDNVVKKKKVKQSTESSKEITEKSNELNQDNIHEVKQENISQERHESSVEKKQGSPKTPKKESVKENIARKSKYTVESLLVGNTIDLSDREIILKNLYTTLKISSQISEVSHVIEITLKRLEKLNASQLTEEECEPIEKYLDRNYRLGKIPNHNFEQILAFFVKNNTEDSKITFDLLHEACWRFRNSQMQFAVNILNSLKNKNTTSKRQEVITEAEEKIMSSIGSIASPSTMLSIMYTLMSDTRFQKRIEEEVGHMLQTMNPAQACKVLYLLATHQSKNLDLIKKVKLHLLSRPIASELGNLMKLFYACDVLKINDSSLLQEMSMNTVDCLSKSRDISVWELLTILNHCSRMSWNNSQLSESMMNIIQNRDIKYTTKGQRISVGYLIVSLGHLNLLQYCEFGSKLVAGSLQPLKEEKPALWLDVMHALACLKAADVKDIKALLSEDFYQPLLDNVKDQAFLQDIYMRKLLSLNGYLKVDINEPTWEFDDAATEWRNSLQNNSRSNLARLSKHVGQVLADFAPLQVYTNTNVATQFGSNIELELFVDKTGKAVKLDESEGKERIWIKVLEINDFLRGSGQPTYTGNTEMAIRHLNDEKNVHVIYVSYVEWNTFESKEDQLKFLESKIKAAVCPEEESTV